MTTSISIPTLWRGGPQIHLDVVNVCLFGLKLFMPKRSTHTFRCSKYMFLGVVCVWVGWVGGGRGGESQDLYPGISDCFECSSVQLATPSFTSSGGQELDSAGALKWISNFRGPS